MDEKHLDLLAFMQAHNERVDRFRRGAQLGATSQDCTCPGVWMSILPPPACPYHGKIEAPRITC